MKMETLDPQRRRRSFASTLAHRVKSPKKDNAYILQMPPEIIDLTLHFLPVESVISLALTCRGLHGRYRDSTKRVLDSSARESLLLLLEKDVAGLYYCYHCSQLHTWNAHPHQQEEGVCNYDAGCMFRDRPDPWVVTGFSYKLKFHTARLVLHNRLRGPSHGPDVERLNMDHAITHSSRNISISESWQAKIIGGELFLRAVWSYHQGKGGATKSLGRWVEHDADRFICNHVRGSRLLEFPGAEGLNLASIERMAGPVRSCPVCYTDFQMEVRGDDWHEEEEDDDDSETESERDSGGWTITVTKWVRMGSCNSPSDPHWQTLASKTTHGLECEPRKTMCEAGEIKHMWADEGAKSSAYQGLFVEPSCLQVPHH